MGVLASILCTAHSWRKTKEQKTLKQYQQVLPEQKTKKSFVFRHVFRTPSFYWNFLNSLIIHVLMT